MMDVSWFPRGPIGAEFENPSRRSVGGTAKARKERRVECGDLRSVQRCVSSLELDRRGKRALSAKQ